jgi:O-antigen ligase
MSAFAALILLQVVFKRSAYLHDTITGAMLYVAYWMLCFLATQTMIRTSEVRRTGVILSLYGFALAVFALLQGISSNGRIYWTRLPRMGGWIYGPYVNHNHYAGMMEMLVPIPLVLALSRLIPEKPRIMAGVAAAIMVGTIFLSGSRGGMIAIFAELAVLATILLRHKRTIRIAIATGAFAVVLVSMLGWLGGKELTARVSSISSEARSEISGGMRLSIDRDALKMFRRKPLLGWGLRSFPVVYPQFRSFYTNFFINEAHDDYVQLLTETGLVGFGIMVWFLVVLYRRAFRKIANSTTQVTGALTLACMLGVTGILVHSFFDFNLQIPANAAWFYVYCSLAAAPPLLQRARKHKPVVTKPEAPAEVVPVSEVV